jgi:dTDP-4-amino-4,6-dideoxygalactose transaminase
VATANAIRYCGARPVFADVASLDEWNVSAETLQAAATEQTRAVVVVHYAGYPCRMEPIRTLARERGWAVIEDAAHAPGATLSGTSAGAWGDAGCFSFFANKNLTTGEGGMVTTQRDDLADRLRRLRSHGMTTLTLERHRGHAFAYDVTDLGYNYRMGELNAALGLAQLERLEQNNRARGTLVTLYRRHLESCSGLTVPFRRPSGEPAYHLMPVLLPPGCGRQGVMERLRAAGIQTSIHYRPVDTFTAYVNAGLGPCPGLENTHRIGEGVLPLPLYPSMTREQVSCVCEALALSV